MGLIFSLKCAEEVVVPSRPLASIMTAIPPGTVVPLIPVILVTVWDFVPTRMVLDSAATPGLPMSILLEAVVRLAPAASPRAMFVLPVVLARRLLLPKAVLVAPVVFL